MTTITHWLQRNGLPFSALLCLFSIGIGQASAAWYETQGQATIINGNKVKAKQQATEEALRQALLFSGASVNSVQRMSNGLLQSNNVEVFAAGDVHQLELVSERWSDDFVTVQIRADIIPTTQQCDASQYSKTIATSYFSLLETQHTQDGQINEIGKAVARRLKRLFDEQARYAQIVALEPYTINWQSRHVKEQAPELAMQTHSQYILSGVIEDVSVIRPRNAGFTLWQQNNATRTFSATVELFDGINGAPLYRNRYSLTKPWQFDRFEQVDTSAQQFWQSEYGSALEDQLQQLLSDVDSALACLPTTGRILRIHNGSEISISLGRQHGLNIGDELTLYQIQEVSNAVGERFIQYHLHPERVVITEAFGDTARAQAINGKPLSNVQAGDFVAKR